jgi:hypothetical protein
MRTRARPVRAASILVAALAVSAFAGVGFLVGRTDRPSPLQAAQVRTSAAADAYRRAELDGYRAAWRAGYRLGKSRGGSAGSASGRRAGLSAGRAEAAKRATALGFVRRVLATALAPVVLNRSTVRDRCVEVGGGLCEVLGPGVTGRPCPTASVPTPEGGVVCVPQLLIQGSQQTAAGDAAARQ